MRGVDFIEFKIQQRPILLIAKEGCSNCKAVEGILSGYHLNGRRLDNYEVLYIESRKDCGVIETYLWHKMIYQNRQVPHLFVDGSHIGGAKEVRLLHESGKLENILRNAGRKDVQ
ncbi:glutaredoxin 3 [Paragonimus westermani]|uniref:Glutaredoxin 3 n=1 Tax=Paragonimus westermani TaxID=34504 RepID=A0A5J4N7K4_9TREM|nr:glutaredoxin 3 [Paragonimus westermani]